MTKSLMIQGTASGVGKSIVTTGICRILKQDGYTVAPFKSQNMSSISHTLDNGFEMARSQAIQAYACKIEPEVDMNPILLKLIDGNMNVIVQGKLLKNMDSFEYKTHKSELLNRITESYKKLTIKYNTIVIEGAGSPVEMNLNTYDIVNMGIARKFNSPVILVSDIHRGGVFASVHGTLSLLSEFERSLVKGIIINKCMGKAEYFKDIKSTMEEITHIPVIGMVPYLNIDIEDEDNLIDSHTGPKVMKTSLSNSEYMEFMDNQFDQLALALRNSLDLEMLYKILLDGV